MSTFTSIMEGSVTITVTNMWITSLFSDEVFNSFNVTTFTSCMQWSVTIIVSAVRITLVITLQYAGDHFCKQCGEECDL